MKILLVSHSFEVNTRIFSYDVNTPYSLGLAYLSTYLQSKGHATDVLWLDSVGPEYAQQAIRERIESMRPEVLGLQLFTVNRVASFRLIEECTKKYPQIRIVVGGIHSSAMYAQIVEKYHNVIAVRGEGEIALGELASAFEKGQKDLAHIRGIVFWQNGQVVVTPERDLNYNLDELPFPDHDVYFKAEPRRTLACVVTSRGCPYKCCFCCLPIISKAKYRPRNIDEVVKEIVALKERYPGRLKTIQFSDDNFTMQNERVVDLCKKLIKLNLGLEYECSARIKPASQEMFYWMEKAGFRKVMFGLETGSAKLMETTHKKINQADVEKLFHMVKDRKFMITTLLIVGFPGENEDTVNETIRFIKKLQRIKYNLITAIGKLWIYPGTEVCQIAKDRGFLTDDIWLTDKDVPHFTVENDLETLKRWENKMLDNFSLLRILTLKGFIHHFMSMPGIIIGFLFQRPELIKSVVAGSIRTYFPRLLYRHDK